MAHPQLAASDPIYWIALAVLIAAPLCVFMAWRRTASGLRVALIVVALLLTLPSGCYALMGTACYVAGDCI